MTPPRQETRSGFVGVCFPNTTKPCSRLQPSCLHQGALPLINPWGAEGQGAGAQPPPLPLQSILPPAGVAPKSGNAAIIKCPTDFPLILWHPYARHYYFCVMTGKEQEKWGAVFQDCVRHCNNGELGAGRGASASRQGAGGPFGPKGWIWGEEGELAGSWGVSQPH